MSNGNTTPMLFPYEPEDFWNQIRSIIREEVNKVKNNKVSEADVTRVEGLTYKPLLKMSEVCQFFQVSRPTIYDWIKHNDLKPFRIRRNVYFLWNDIQRLIDTNAKKSCN